MPVVNFLTFYGISENLIETMGQFCRKSLYSCPYLSPKVNRAHNKNLCFKPLKMRRGLLINVA